MDDEAALLARQVAMAASAWRHAKADTEAYRRIIDATSHWDAYSEPKLDEPDADDAPAQLRRAARRALRAMDDDAALLARQVAITASAWLHGPTDPETYRRLVDAIDEWNSYDAPQLEAPAEELLDRLADDSAPLALSEVLADFSAQISKAAHRDH